MRVLWLAKGLGAGGAEQLLLESIQCLDRDRYSVDLAYTRPDRNHLTGQFEQVGLNPIDCGGKDWWRKIANLVRGNYEIVHSHAPTVAVVARAALAAPGGRARHVYTEHNLWPRYHQATRRANALTYPFDSHRFAVSQEVADSTTHPAGTEVLHHGIDVAGVGALRSGAAAARSELGFDDRITVGTVANFREQKDHPTLLRVAAEVESRQPGAFHFVLVGQGPLEDATRRMVSEMGLDRTVTVMGYRDDARRVTSALDAILMTSKFEGLPVALMEAQALGIPVVSTRVGGVPEIITDGQNGLLREAGDVQGLADAVVSMADPTVRSTMAQHALDTAGNFSAARAAARIAEVYEQLLAGKGTS